MRNAFTIPEQQKLLEHSHITYVSKNVIKFTKELLKEIGFSCSSIPEIRELLYFHDLPATVITEKRIKYLYTRYVSKVSFPRINMPRKYFTDDEIKLLEQLAVVSKVTPSTLTFDAEFKVKIATCVYLTSARELMLDNKVPLDIIGDRRFENTYYRLRDQKRKKGDASFSSEQRGRKPSTNAASYQNLTAEEK